MAQSSPETTGRETRRKVRQGVVVSNKMTKSIVVEVTRTVRHPLYDKVIRRGKKFLVHDEAEEAKVGDLVRIAECRPMSRRKRWRFVELVHRPEA